MATYEITEESHLEEYQPEDKTSCRLTQIVNDMVPQSDSTVKGSTPTAGEASDLTQPDKLGSSKNKGKTATFPVNPETPSTLYIKRKGFRLNENRASPYPGGRSNPFPYRALPLPR